jgi:hypothetical protein
LTEVIYMINRNIATPQSWRTQGSWSAAQATMDGMSFQATIAAVSQHNDL